MVKRKDFNATLKQLTDGLERLCSGNVNLGKLAVHLSK